MDALWHGVHEYLSRREQHSHLGLSSRLHAEISQITRPADQRGDLFLYLAPMPGAMLLPVLVAALLAGGVVAQDNEGELQLSCPPIATTGWPLKMHAVKLTDAHLPTGLKLVPHRDSSAARSLLANSYQQPGFWSLIPQKCYRGQYGSPYRMSLDGSFLQEGSTTFSFKLFTVDCPVQGSQCCNQQLDHLLLRTGAITWHQAPAVHTCGAGALAPSGHGVALHVAPLQHMWPRTWAHAQSQSQSPSGSRSHARSRSQLRMSSALACHHCGVCACTSSHAPGTHMRRTPPPRRCRRHCHKRAAGWLSSQV
jgi:hypothetical protein